MNTRAQGLSLNVIIVAAIALVIMVILITLVVNSGGQINQGANSCEAINGRCEPSGLCGSSEVPNNLRNCPEEQFGEGAVCCVALGQQ